MIYKAVKSDASDIAELAVMMWENHTVEELAKDFNNILSNEENAVFIFCKDNQKIGFAQCGLRHDYVEGTESSPVGYPEGVFIKQEFRKNGYARALVSKCEEWAKEQGCSEFASDCELDNDVSLRFHIKMGFTETNRIICFDKKL